MSRTRKKKKPNYIDFNLPSSGSGCDGLSCVITPPSDAHVNIDHSGYTFSSKDFVPLNEHKNITQTSHLPPSNEILFHDTLKIIVSTAQDTFMISSAFTLLDELVDTGLLALNASENIRYYSNQVARTLAIYFLMASPEIALSLTAMNCLLQLKLNRSTSSTVVTAVGLGIGLLKSQANPLDTLTGLSTKLLISSATTKYTKKIFQGAVNTIKKITAYDFPR